MLSGQRPSAKIRNKMHVFRPSTHFRRGTGPAQDRNLIPVIFALAEAQLHDSCVPGCLSLASCLELRTRSLHPSTGLSVSTQEALQVHRRLVSSVDKGDRSDSVAVTMIIYGKYILSTNGSKRSYSIQAIIRGCGLYGEWGNGL